jgi:hypothetical protein
MLSLELGAPRLAYGFALAAGTLVDSLRPEFFKTRPGAVAMAARRMSQLPKKGVICFYHPFCPPCRNLKRRKLGT